jgi:hypothetical protein
MVELLFIDFQFDEQLEEPLHYQTLIRSISLTQLANKNKYEYNTLNEHLYNWGTDEYLKYFGGIIVPPFLDKLCCTFNIS